MSDLDGAALTFGGLFLVWALIVFAVWWMRRPRPDVPAYGGPAMRREGKLPALPKISLSRKAAPEPEPVEISASRLARISGKYTPEYPVDEPAYEPAVETVEEAQVAEPDRADEPAAEDRFDPPAPDTAATEPLEAVSEPLPTEPLPSPETPLLDEATLEALASEVEEQARTIDRPAADRAAVRLIPQNPPRDAIFRKSWLGGRPHLPSGAEWPRVDGNDGDFLAQIACDELPPALWDGLGPRTGSLAFFANPDNGAVTALHVVGEAVPHDPPRPVGSAYFHPHGVDAADLMPLAIRAFPEWPVDIVAVTPDVADPRDGATFDAAALLAADYDIADPAFHPFDWPSMLALADILESRLAQQPLDGSAPEDANDELVQTIAEADERNRDAVQRAAEIVAIIREGAEQGASFSPSDATAVMAGLHAIRWTRVWTVADEESGEDRVETVSFPLTRHRPDGDLWVDAYRTILFDHAKHAWCRNPDTLSAPARAFFEPLWEAMALHETPSMGNFPSQHAVGFDDERDVVMIEFPAGGLMSRGPRSGGNLVLAIRKADLVAGDFSKMRALSGN